MGEAEGFHGVAEGPFDGEGQDEISVVLRPRSEAKQLSDHELLRRWRQTRVGKSYFLCLRERPSKSLNDGEGN